MKKQPDFRLQKVLQVREMKEHERQKALAVSEKKLTSEEEDLRKLRNKRDELVDDVKNMQQARAGQLLGRNKYLAAISESITSKKTKIEAVKKKVWEKRQELLSAAKEKKSLENLKAKKLREQRYSVNKMEQSFIDEIAIKRAYFSKSEK